MADAAQIDESTGFVLESYVSAQESLKVLQRDCPPQAEIDRFPPNSAREVKLKPRAPGVPGYPGIPNPPSGPPVPGTPGTPGQPGFPGSDSHADLKIYICRKGKCDFVLYHRKIVIPPGERVTVKWKRCWCKAVVEAQLGVVVVTVENKDIYLIESDGEAMVRPVHPPCPDPVAAT